MTDRLFHIVYTPGTFRFLRPALMSLLEHSPYRYRLVANGLGGEELEGLLATAQSDDRLSACTFPARQPLHHGTMLSLLLWPDPATSFCFCDSDIFATGPFSEALEQALEGGHIFSSCRALLWPGDERLEGFLGQSTHSPGGARLPATFFGVWPAAPLKRALAEHGITLERYHNPRLVPEAAAAAARRLGWDGRAFLDTGKLAASVLVDQGLTVRHQELDGLLHVGGISSWLRAAFQGGEPTAMPEAYVLDDGEVEGPLENGHWLAGNLARVRRKDGEVAAQRVRERLVAARYMASALLHAHDMAPAPRLALSPGWLRRRIKSARLAVEDISRRHPWPG